MEQYRPSIIRGITIFCFVASIYLFSQLAVADADPAARPYWELFDESPEDNARAAIPYILIGIFLGLATLAVAVLTIEFAYNLIHGAFSRFLPVDWRTIIFPVVLPAVLLTCQAWKGPIKHTAMSAYLQVDQILAAANGYDPAIRNE